MFNVIHRHEEEEETALLELMKQSQEESPINEIAEKSLSPNDSKDKADIEDLFELKKESKNDDGGELFIALDSNQSVDSESVSLEFKENQKTPALKISSVNDKEVAPRSMSLKVIDRDTKPKYNFNVNVKSKKFIQSQSIVEDYNKLVSRDSIKNNPK